MVNINKLRASMVERGINVDLLSVETGIPKDRLYRRFKNPEEITIEEADAIITALKTDCNGAISIFFTQLLA
jgi:hypothetical protein